MMCVCVFSCDGDLVFFLLNLPSLRLQDHGNMENNKIRGILRILCESHGECVQYTCSPVPAAYP